MSEDIKGRTLNYLTCTQGDMHEGEQLNFVCLDSTCKEMGLICPVCRSQKHQKHKVLPLKIFLADISTNLNGKSNQNSIDSLLQQVDIVRNKVLASLKDTVQKMVIQIKTLEEQIDQSHKNTKARLLEQNQTQMNFPMIFQQIINSQYKSVESLKQDVRKIIENVSQQQPGKIEIEFKPQKLFDSYQKASQESINQLNQLLVQFKQQIQKISKPIEKFTLPVIPQNFNGFTFSPANKSNTIQIIDQRIAHQTVNQNSENRFILLDPQLQESAKIAFKVIQMGNFIGVGIAYKNALIGKNLRFDHQNLGHGSYMISSNGHMWSHSKKDENMVIKSFTFTTGDIIIIDFNLENKTLKFTCKSKPNDSTTLTFDNPENDDIHFCVNMCSAGEKVEIIDDFE